MANGNNGFTGKTKVVCGRANCTGVITLGLLAHKHSVGDPPTCRVCASAGFPNRRYQFPKGAGRDVKLYPRDGKQQDLPKANSNTKAQKGGGGETPVNVWECRTKEREAKAAKILEWGAQLFNECKAQNPNVQLPPPPVELEEEAPDSGNLQQYLAAKASLEKLGLSVPKELEDKITLASNPKQGAQHTLPVLLAKVEKAEKFAAKCCDARLQKETEFERAVEKAKKAELVLADLLRQKAELLQKQEGMVKTNTPAFLVPEGANQQQVDEYKALYAELNKAKEAKEKEIEVFLQTFAASEQRIKKDVAAALKAKEEAAAEEAAKLAASSAQAPPPNPATTPTSGAGAGGSSPSGPAPTATTDQGGGGADAMATETEEKLKQQVLKRQAAAQADAEKQAEDAANKRAANSRAKRAASAANAQAQTTAVPTAQSDAHAS